MPRIRVLRTQGGAGSPVPRGRTGATGLALQGPVLASVLLVLMSALSGVAQAQQPPPAEDAPVEAAPESAILPTPVGYKLAEGKVPVLDFMRFIQSSTGLVVEYPSLTEDQFFGQESQINVLGEIEPLTYPMVKSLLEVNGYEVYHEKLENGQEVIKISHSQMRVGRSEGPAVTDVYGPKEQAPAEAFDQIATMVLKLQFADTQTVVQALRDLVSVGAAAPQRSGSSVTVVQVASTNSLILKAKVAILRHIQELVEYIDVEVKGPKPFFEVIAVYNADAEELVQVISEVLNVDAQTVRTGRARTTRAPAGQPAGQQVPQPRQQEPGQYTRLIADLRTQKIIVDTTSEAQLDLISQLIDELDIKVENLRPSTHIYKAKYLKATDLADNLSQLIEGTSRAGGSLRAGRTTRTAPAAAGQAAGQQQEIATRIVPHEDTNSLLIQADYEEYLEMARILEGIDRKRKQVFLEAALVQVNEGSSLNYTLEYLAGDLDDQATRAAALTAFGLTVPAVTTSPLSLDRTFPTTGGAATGIFGAISRNGQLPVLLRAIKSDSDAKVLATPFILADDNETSDISSTNTIFFETTTSTNTGTSTGQGETQAGINLSLTPTISENVVLISMTLQVSSFGSSSSGTGGVPDRSDNTINSQVTVADGELFIIGGLARESDSLAVDKVPILGDLPIIGRLFQSRNSTRTRNNLYVFLTAHILRSQDFRELRDISDQAREGVRGFNQEFNNHFESPRSRGVLPEPQPEGER